MNTKINFKSPSKREKEKFLSFNKVKMEKKKKEQKFSEIVLRIDPKLKVVSVYANTETAWNIINFYYSQLVNNLMYKSFEKELKNFQINKVLYLKRKGKRTMVLKIKKSALELLNLFEVKNYKESKKIFIKTEEIKSQISQVKKLLKEAGKI